MPTRVLHLLYNLGPGGIETWVMSLLRVADRSRIAMDFCCRGPNTGFAADFCRSLGAEVYHCELRPTQIGFLGCLGKLLETNRYAVIHNHLGLYAGLGTFIGNKYNVPVITSFHSTGFQPQAMPKIPLLFKLRELYGNLSFRYAVRNSTLVTGCSKTVLNKIDNLYKIPTGRGKVIYYGVALGRVGDENEKISFKKEFGISEDKIIITHVGSMRPPKNHQGIIRVAEKVVAADSRAHFILIGRGNLKPIIEEMIRAKQLENHFTLLGYVEDLERVLRCSDIFFFPSLWEGLPLSVLEAMAAGLPVVASDIDQIKEEVTEGVTGILCPVQEEQEMAVQLLDLMNNPEKRRWLGENGRQKVASEFSLDHAAEELWKTYESISHPGI
jgi:glycosyltransferase EpsF